VKVPRTRARWTRWIYREAVALARVKHPGLPTVFEVGQLDGLPYLVMELVGGPTFAERIAAGPLSGAAVLEVAIQLADILAAIHALGLVHRDVKPRNIIAGPGGMLRLVDFGFTTPMERTGDGETAGTAAYAAPEQLVPPGRVDARSDLYGLGRVLLECLSPELFATSSSESGDVRAGLALLSISPRLADVISTLLQHNPQRRYPDAHTLLADLHRIRAGQPIVGPKGQAVRRPLPHLPARSAQLASALETTRNLGRGGRLVVVHGQRGSGKTRLLECVIAENTDLATVSVTPVHDDPPLATLRRLLEASCTTADIGAEALGELAGNLAPILGMISPSLGGGARPATEATIPIATDALVEGAAEIFVRLARRLGGLVLVIDDLHWADAASASALLRLAHRAAEVPLALVIGMGDDGDLLRRFLALRDHDVPTVAIELEPLTAEGVAYLICGYLSSEGVPLAAIDRITSMVDGTPLGVLEVLGAFLDAGAIRPHQRGWAYDEALVGAIELPRGALALLGRRLTELPVATRRVLEAAAEIGLAFEEELVAQVLDLSTETSAYAMVDARRAGVIESGRDGVYRFIHDSLRETLLADLSAAEHRKIHQRIGELLSESASPSFEQLCRSARHLAQGELDRDPARSYRTLRAAAMASLEHYDDRATLEFHREACAAAKRAKIAVDSQLYRVAGEAELRLGSVDRSIAELERALACADSRVERATILGRIAWAYEAHAEPEPSWKALERAFVELGARLPVEDAASARDTAFQFARSKLGRLFPKLGTGRAHSAEERELLCRLHYQNLRLAFEYGKVARAVQSSLASAAIVLESDPPAMRAKARTLNAFLVAALGRREAGVQEARDALALARSSTDPIATAFCLKMLAMVLSWAGHFEEAIELFDELVRDFGPWAELPEYCLFVQSGEGMLAYGGNQDQAWAWNQRMLARLKRSDEFPRVALSGIHRARASLALMDQTAEPGSWLARKLDDISFSDPGVGYHRVISWGPRAMYLLATNNFGPALEQLIADFEAEKYDPKTVHVGATEYYFAVAHARMQQCFRATAAERVPHVKALAKAAKDLRATARLPILKAHALVAEGCLAYYKSGDRAKADALLAEASKVGSSENAPWILYSVARARAHFLRDQGNLTGAHEQARVAEFLAQEHGALSRARCIREEFLLADRTVRDPSQVTHSSHGSSQSRTNRQLAVLLQVAKSPRRDLQADQQAGAILDELLVVLRAERGAIWFQPELPSMGTTVERHKGSGISISISAESPRGTLLRRVHAGAQTWPLAPGIESRVKFYVDPAIDPARTLVVPLSLYASSVGALSIERGEGDPPFTVEDRHLLELLAHQVPVALEIARLLAERDKLQASLVQSQKMEAIGQLAGGLAHDFNNMLAALKVALQNAQEQAANDAEIMVELDVISQATTRASQLTSQLLSFARNQPLPMSVHDLNQLVVGIEPMLRRVATTVNVMLKLSPVVDAVVTDPASFDQVLMNLLINARDAMPRGGDFIIATRNVVLDENNALCLQLAAGPYVELEVTDTGEGMSQDTMNRIFEPFFTTKAPGLGTGLGLATVYGFAKSCGGAIDVSSELGKGTSFRLYMKRADRPRSARPVRPLPPSRPPGGVADTILVVDDDDLVRRSIAKILERHGYRVVAANGSAEALDVARAQGTRIALVIMDVLLPGVTGPELGRRLNDILPAKLLFVSGFSAESAPIEDAKVTPEMLLQKPFSQSALLERVRKLMSS
jgi:signal transduction histidine kinase/CheY-like chemotaxis protein